MTQNLIIADITNKGRGVVAGRDYSKGEIIECCAILVFDRYQASLINDLNLTGYCFPYWYNEEGDEDKGSSSVALAFGFASMLNHSSTPNVDWRIDPQKKTLEIYAVDHILRGDELVMDYKIESAHIQQFGWVD